MKKLIIAVALAVMLPMSVWSTDLSAEWSQTITMAEINTNIRDTFYTGVLNTVRDNYVYYWRTVIVGRKNVIDTVFGGDTLYIMTEHSPTGVSDWSLFDSTKIVFNGDADTTLVPWVRISYDSTIYCGNYWRVKLVNGFTLSDAAADTNIVGNTYNYDVEVWFEGKP